MQVWIGLAVVVGFYVVERTLGTEAGIVAALVFCAGDVAWHRYRHGAWNTLVLGMAALVVVLGGLSLLSDDERFFLWSPVVGDVVFAGVLIGSVGVGRPLLNAMMAVYQPDLDPTPSERAWFAGITWRLGLVLLLHGAWTGWATTEPRETWVFVSGIGQYLLLGVQVLLEAAWVRWVRPLPDDVPPPENPPHEE